MNPLNSSISKKRFMQRVQAEWCCQVFSEEEGKIFEDGKNFDFAIIMVPGPLLEVVDVINAQEPQVVEPPANTVQKVKYKIIIREEETRRKKRQSISICRGTIFNPRNWNYGPVKSRNNCYNYATNIITNTFAQPGTGGGKRHVKFTAESVYRACLRDGLVPIPERSPYRIPRVRRYCLMALVIWPNEDFHFLRRDLNGFWTQKNGRGPPRNYDDSRRPISDPRRCNNGPYKVFAGFLGCHPNIRIR